MKDIRLPLLSRGRDKGFFAALYVILALALLICLLSLVYGGIYVDGGSMKDTLHDGDFVVMNKLAKPERGDIVVVYTGRKEAELVIKRAVALGGDALYAEDGVLYLKRPQDTAFSAVEEGYLFEEWEDCGMDKPDSFFSAEAPLVLAEDEIFYMGDNRNDSYDCRAYGPQPASHVVGVVTDWSLSVKGVLTALFSIFA